MPTDFETAINYVLSFEDSTLSGLVTTDAGGKTRFGIASNFNTTSRDFYTEPAAEALIEAKHIYQAKYWMPFGWKYLTSQTLATIMLDCAVNPGTGTATEFLQSAINIYKLVPIDEDGDIGVHTVAAANSFSGLLLAATVQSMRASHYRKHSPSIDLNGLLRRASTLPASNS